MKPSNKQKKVRTPLLVRRLVGNSRLPVLPPGTTVIATGWMRRTRVGQVVIVSHEGKEKIKRIQDIRPREIYIEGDHLTASKDSRHFGWLGENAIVAKVIWPKTKKKT